MTYSTLKATLLSVLFVKCIAQELCFLNSTFCITSRRIHAVNEKKMKRYRKANIKQNIQFNNQHSSVELLVENKQYKREWRDRRNGATISISWQANRALGRITKKHTSKTILRIETIFGMSCDRHLTLSMTFPYSFIFSSWFLGNQTEIPKFVHKMTYMEISAPRAERWEDLQYSWLGFNTFLFRIFFFWRITKEVKNLQVREKGKENKEIILGFKKKNKNMVWKLKTEIAGNSWRKFGKE